MDNQPANDAITSCNANATAAPASPRAVLKPPGLLLKTILIKMIVKK
jgi:hypothetical protein